jgi:hypothetical protein
MVKTDRADVAASEPPHEDLDAAKPQDHGDEAPVRHEMPTIPAVPRSVRREGAPED